VPKKLRSQIRQLKKGFPGHATLLADKGATVLDLKRHGVNKILTDTDAEIPGSS
jgi:hypothetical protein